MKLFQGCIVPRLQATFQKGFSQSGFTINATQAINPVTKVTYSNESTK